MNKPVDNLRQIKYDFNLFSKKYHQEKGRGARLRFLWQSNQYYILPQMCCHWRATTTQRGIQQLDNIAENFFVVTMTNFMSLVVVLVFLLLLSWFLMFSGTKAAIIFYFSTFNEFQDIYFWIFYRGLPNYLPKNIAYNL